MAKIYKNRMINLVGSLDVCFFKAEHFITEIKTFYIKTFKYKNIFKTFIGFIYL